MVFQPVAYECPPFNDESPLEDKGAIEYEAGLPYKRQTAKRSTWNPNELLDHKLVAMNSTMYKQLFYL